MNKHLDALDALISRLRSTTGPSEELDARVICALEYPNGYATQQGPFVGWGIIDLADLGKAHRWLWRAGFTKDSAITASVDACIALAERLLPGWNWFLGIECGDKEYCAKLFDPSTIESLRRTASVDDEYGATPALAMLGAILSAVRGRQQGSLR
jgi:hypothetical protein